MSPRLLEGDVVPSDPVDEIILLRGRVDELRGLNRDLTTALENKTRELHQATKALAILKRQLTPLYTALQAIFGELEIVDDAPSTGDTAPAAAANPRHSAVWQQWKDKLGKGPSAIIDALLTHGPSNIQQLAVLCGYNRNTVPQYIADLKRVGLVTKQGDGKFALRQL